MDAEVVPEDQFQRPVPRPPEDGLAIKISSTEAVIYWAHEKDYPIPYFSG